MKAIMKKIADILGIVFGYGIMICLLFSGCTFFGYLFALIVGGELAATICTFIYKQYFPVIIYVSSLLVLLGLVKMYLSGETALTISAKREKARQKKAERKAVEK